MDQPGLHSKLKANHFLKNTKEGKEGEKRWGGEEGDNDKPKMTNLSLRNEGRIKAPRDRDKDSWGRRVQEVVGMSEIGALGWEGNRGEMTRHRMAGEEPTVRAGRQKNCKSRAGETAQWVKTPACKLSTVLHMYAPQHVPNTHTEREKLINI